MPAGAANNRSVAKYSTPTPSFCQKMLSQAFSEFLGDFYPSMTIRLLSRYALALLFVLAGTWHFIHPATYLAIMPPQLPQPLALVYVSGVFEILGGLGLLPAPTRQLAGWGLLALLVAVFPANVYMALAHEQLHIPGWIAWGRLPLQLPLLWWVWRVMHQR
jgi:uncharacterized membrane protein